MATRFDLEHWQSPIPLRAAAAFRTQWQNPQAQQNPSLLFERYAPDWQNDTTAKKNGLYLVQEAAQRADAALLKDWNRRWEGVAASVQAVGFTMSTDWRFVTGLGQKGPLEIGFTFHRYGFPILPGSSVKGIARAFAVAELKEEEAAAANPDFIAIFGRIPTETEPPEMAQAGHAIFLDGVPKADELPALELDIMNPHYPKYYGNEQPPTNWQDPIPVYFLTVAPLTDFRFAVGWRGPSDAKLQQKAADWLVGGLKELGAGAKTSAGYGFFLTPEESAPRKALRAQRAAALLQVRDHAPSSSRPSPRPQHYAEAPAPKSQRAPKAFKMPEVGSTIQGIVREVESDGTVWLAVNKAPENIIAIIRPDQLQGKQYRIDSQARLEVISLNQKAKDWIVECRPAARKT